MEKIKIGISIGDINGIGPEVILKTLSDKILLERCTPVIFGSSKVLAYHKNFSISENLDFASLREEDSYRENKVNVVNCWTDEVKINLGEISAEAGKCAYIALEKATTALKNKKIDALVTAPIHKKAMQMASFPHPGHTEYITKALGNKPSMMLLVNGDLRVGLVSSHVPLKEVASTITKEALKRKLSILNNTLKIDFGIEKPIIAVLGLNPHAGDNGVIGTEEEQIIKPFLVEAKKHGILAMGPYPADGFFGSGKYKKVDAILAMYHDQGLAPFKALSFGAGVNFTAGLDGIRTSPDHGTAFDVAGKGVAEEGSFRSALYLAMDVARQRKAYHEMHKNPIVKSKQRSER